MFDILQIWVKKLLSPAKYGVKFATRQSIIFEVNQ